MRLLLLDCDSTLSSIEGIDELARTAGEEKFTACVELTHAAMNGEVAVEEVFARRLELISPTKEQADKVAQLYIDTVLAGVKETLASLQQQGWTCMIVSGGFAPLIAPLAEYLGVARVEAVPLFFDAKGAYGGYGKEYPTTRSGGKPEIVAQLRQEYSPRQIVFVGDGVSDLETKPHVDLFVACTAVEQRKAVVEGADALLAQFQDLPAILAKLPC